MVNYTNLPGFHLKFTPAPMRTLDLPSWPEIKDIKNLQSHGKISVQERTLSFGFQIHARTPMPRPSIVFTLSQTSGETNRRPVQFGIRVDFESGEIWDIANKSGVLGFLEKDLWPAQEGEYPITLRWEVEHTGHVLIPRLIVGDEEWLYPSLLFPGQSEFIAMTGHDLKGQDDSAVLSAGYVWCQDRI